MRLAVEPLHRGDRAVWALCLVFGVVAGSLLDSLDYNFDEGVYIHQARLILGGALPYTDFFYHQTPVYPFTLALAGLFAPESLFAYRLPSLVATALQGVIVYRIALEMMPKAAAWAAALLFYAAPLQFFGPLALPNALMACLATLGVYLVWFRQPGTRRSEQTAACLAGALIGLSVLFKPLSVPVAIAVGCALLASSARRARVGAFIAGGTGVGLGV
jgi:4-amino-4-deoxy-L-arabinose transferase-like glycosyltransferase